MGDTAIALDLLSGVSDVASELGKTVSLKQFAEGTWIDAANKSKGKTITSTSYSCSVIVSDYKAEQVDGEIIRHGDKKYIVSLSGLSILPNTGDQIIDGSVTLNVVDVEMPEVAGVEVVAECQCREK